MPLDVVTHQLPELRVLASTVNMLNQCLADDLRHGCAFDLGHGMNAISEVTIESERHVLRLFRLVSCGHPQSFPLDSATVVSRYHLCGSTMR